MNFLCFSMTSGIRGESLLRLHSPANCRTHPDSYTHTTASSAVTPTVELYPSHYWTWYGVNYLQQQGVDLVASAVMIGADVYMPIYIQNILGLSATVSGLSMSPMSISWLLASVVLAKAIPRYYDS